MKTILLNISDIHIGSDTPENEGLVLNSFLKDVEEQIRKLRYDKIYVLIGGDLVFASSKAKYHYCPIKKGNLIFEIVEL